MPAIHPEILDQHQQDLLPLVSKFGNDFYLVGGTALALQYGHRRSLDFDLFTPKSFDNERIRQQLRAALPIEKTYLDSQGQLTVQANTIRLTFYQYPFTISHPINLAPPLTRPKPITIAAMKAFALGRRAKWKDYVDLYFVFQRHSLPEVVSEAQHIFGPEFNEKLFREQLAYHQDINYSDAPIFMPGFAADTPSILNFLIQTSTS